MIGAIRAVDAAPVKVDGRSFVIFQIDRRRFALPAHRIAELAPPVRLHAFPSTTPLVAGVIVRRGRIVPVCDAAPVLVERDNVPHRFYLVVRLAAGDASTGEDENLVAIPVSGECELASADTRAPEGRPAYVASSLSVHGEALDVLDLEKLMALSSRTERGALEEVQP